MIQGSGVLIVYLGMVTDPGLQVTVTDLDRQGRLTDPGQQVMVTSLCRQLMVTSLDLSL